MKGAIQAHSVRVGGLAVELDPYIFMRLVNKRKLMVIHGEIGVFTQWHVYLAISGGLTFYTKSSEPIWDIPVEIEASKLHRQFQM
jgi:hypothetical protein